MLLAGAEPENVQSEKETTGLRALGLSWGCSFMYVYPSTLWLLLSSSSLFWLVVAASAGYCSEKFLGILENIRLDTKIRWWPILIGQVLTAVMSSCPNTIPVTRSIYYYHCTIEYFISIHTYIHTYIQFYCTCVHVLVPVCEFNTCVKYELLFLSIRSTTHDLLYYQGLSIRIHSWLTNKYQQQQK